MILIIPAIVLNLARINLILSTIDPHKDRRAIFCRRYAIDSRVWRIYPITEHALQWLIAQIAIGFVITGYVLTKLISQSASRTPVADLTRNHQPRREAHAIMKDQPGSIAS